MRIKNLTFTSIVPVELGNLIYKKVSFGYLNCPLKTMMRAVIYKKGYIIQMHTKIHLYMFVSKIVKIDPAKTCYSFLPLQSRALKSWFYLPAALCGNLSYIIIISSRRQFYHRKKEDCEIN